MLVTSIFSFSCNVFNPSQNKYQFFSQIYFVVCKCFQFRPVLNISFGKELTDFCYIPPPPHFEEGGDKLFLALSVRPSVCYQYFPSHFSQQPCITATSNLVWCFSNFSFSHNVFYCLENFLSFSSNLKLSSANSFSLEESKICRLGKG